jgi:hypothetical protein
LYNHEARKGKNKVILSDRKVLFEDFHERTIYEWIDIICPLSFAKEVYFVKFKTETSFEEIYNEREMFIYNGEILYSFSAYIQNEEGKVEITDTYFNREHHPLLFAEEDKTKRMIKEKEYIEALTFFKKMISEEDEIRLLLMTGLLKIKEC